jgi:hypothetical protein
MTPRACLNAWLHQSAVVKLHEIMTHSIVLDRRAPRAAAKNPSAPVSLLRALSRSEDEATRKAVVTNPRAPYDVLSYLENQFPDLFVNDPALELYNSLKI